MKKINYNDKSYRDKRTILRKHFNGNTIIFQIIENQKKLFSTLLADVEQKYNIEVTDFLQKLLIDGYIAIEKIYNKNGDLIHTKELDASSLVAANIGGSNVWVRFVDTPMERILQEKDVIYIACQQSDFVPSDYFSYADLIYYITKGCNYAINADQRALIIQPYLDQFNNNLPKILKKYFIDVAPHIPKTEITEIVGDTPICLYCGQPQKLIKEGDRVGTAESCKGVYGCDCLDAQIAKKLDDVIHAFGAAMVKQYPKEKYRIDNTRKLVRIPFDIEN